MANLNEQLPQWDNAGLEPSADKKTNGWQVTEKPPAQWFNWLFNRIYKCVQEIQTYLNGATLTANITGNAATVAGKAPGTLAGKLAYYDANIRVIDSVSVGGKIPGTAAGNVAYYDGSGKIPAANLPNAIQGGTLSLSMNGITAGARGEAVFTLPDTFDFVTYRLRGINVADNVVRGNANIFIGGASPTKTLCHRIGGQNLYACYGVYSYTSIPSSTSNIVASEDGQSNLANGYLNGNTIIFGYYCALDYTAFDYLYLDWEGFKL